MKNSVFDVIYVEKHIQNHIKTLEILQKYKNKTVIPIDHYGEIFNRRSQNFRLQKEKPALILAKKHRGFLNSIPKNYGIGSNQNFYFSHFLNCPFDCSYCFLQGHYLSANYVFFVNYEDFQEEISRTINSMPHERFTFFSGYDADSLAMDYLSGFTSTFIPFFKQFANAELEIRTKSAYIKPLLNIPPSKNIIIAYTLSPNIIVKHFEKKTPSLDKRLESLIKLQQLGYPIGLRFDPMIYHKDFEKNYSDFFNHVFHTLDPSLIHSVTLGYFRLPRGTYKQMRKNAPQDKLLATCVDSGESMMSYSQEIRHHLVEFCRLQLLQHIPENKLFICH